MLEAFRLSIKQLADRRILQLLAKVVLLTLMITAVAGYVIYVSMVQIIGGIDLNKESWATSLAELLLLFAPVFAFLIAILLFRIIVIFAINIFSDDVVDAVEAKYYPTKAEQARPPSYALGVRMGLASAGRGIGYNLLASPIYIGLLVTGIGTAVAFLAVNAVLIGRDLQDMIASRHIPDYRNLDSQWQLPKMTRFGLGLVVAFLLTIPFVNFLAPIVGAAMATHLVHRQRLEEI